MWIFIIILGFIFLGALLYWLLIITEGVYLGRRAVVWMYDLTAHKYDGIKEYDADAEELFVIRPLRYYLHHIPAPYILDVATGTGRLPWFLLQQPTFHGRVVGLDASAKMLSQAAAKLDGFHARAALVQGTAVPLPFPDNTFHAVTCLESLEFFPSDEAALRDMIRVLQPGGLLLVTRRRGWEAKTFFGRYHDTTQFEQLLQEMGCEQVETKAWQVDYDQVFARKPSTA
ncbi:MAG: class I SAM-dependent methyltransferase [Anaerolineales bacterium]|nr:class I SAM-dependent methyltransferase [Anaerolineales bacterium]MCB8967220.1 class I SAM-dependent methyltransferase [Ardenticatenaceae bacterium]